MFGARPDDERRRFYLPVFHFEPRRPVHVLAVSDLEGLSTHFIGRTRACPGPAVCRLCAIGRPSRYQGYFAAIVERRKVLVRLTAQGALRMLAHPPSPGSVYRADLPSVRRPLELSLDGSCDVPEGAEVSQFELVAVLMSLHGLGLPDGSTSADDLRRLASERAKELIDQEAILIA